MNQKQKELLGFYFPYHKPYWRLVVVAALLLLVNILLQLPMPLITRYLIDVILPRKDFQALGLICIILFLILIFRQVSGYFYTITLVKYRTSIHLKIETDLYAHIQELPFAYFTQKSPGYILSRMSEVSSTQTFMADTFLYVLKDVITILVGSILILNLHFILGVFSLALLPFFIFALKFFHEKIKKITKELHEVSALYYSKVEKNLNSIEKIKSSVKEKEEVSRIYKKLSKVIEKTIKSEILNTIASLVASFIGAIAPFFVLWYGISEIMKGSLTLGTFFAVNAFLAYLYAPAQRLTQTGFSLSRAWASMERVYEIFKERKEPGGEETIQGIDRIEFKDVDFSYNNGSQTVLKNFNLEIKAGEKVALVGESGEGKSTIVRLIFKFFEPTRGRIHISNKELGVLELKRFRSRIAYVSQNQKILESDIQEKITDARFKKYLQKLNIKKSIFEDYIVKQSELSGGEVQRFEIIETLLKKADVIIIDEGTSNLDYITERAALKEIFDKYKGKIMIFIAHRLSSITEFDRILVLKDGQITEEGTHAELLKRNGVYKRIWDKQNESLVA